MAKIDLNDYKALYNKTAQEYIQSLMSNVQLLEQNPASIESTDAAHLAAHSLKSQSMVMGYTTTGELCHELENYFHALQEANNPLPLQHLPQLKQALAALQRSLEAIMTNGTEQDLSAAITAFREGVAA